MRERGSQIGINTNPELTTPQDNFRVESQRLEEAYAWLQTQKQNEDDPFTSDDMVKTIPLGGISIRDSMVSEIGLGLVYLPEDYQYVLAATIGISENEPSIPAKKEVIIDQALVGQMDDITKGIKEYLTEQFRIFQNQDDTNGPVDLDDLAYNLEAAGRINGYEIDPNETDDDKLLIYETVDEDTEEPREKTEEDYIEIHIDEDDDYHLEFTGNTDEDLEKFKKRIKLFGQIIQDSVNTIYRENKLESPNKKLIITPPKNTLLKIEHSQKRAKVQKSLMTSTGMLDEGLADEIQANMLEEKPDVRFEDVGGQEEAKEALDWAVYGLTHPEVFTEEGSDITRGVLMYGPSGTGKTLLARATAGEANAAFFNTHISDIVHPLYGKAEKNLTAIFKAARTNQPAVILFDEFNALGGQIQGSSEVSNRMVHVLLTNLQEVNDNGDRILVLGTTNLKEDIYAPLIRAGRFDRVVEVGLPNDEARGHIFQIHMNKAEKKAGKTLFDGVDISELIKQTPGLSGADLSEIVRRVLANRVKARKTGEAINPTTTEDILKVISKYERGRKTEKRMGFRKIEA